MGEGPGFQQVYDEHFRFVWRSLRRLGVREGDVADAAQDVFLVVHRRLGAFEGKAKMSTWLYGICMRVASDRRRSAFSRRSVGDDGSIERSPDERPSAHAEAERRQGLALLEAILDEMPLEQRAVFTLFELDGMKGEAIAELLEVPLGTVYSRLRLAREVFKRASARVRARGERPGAPGGAVGLEARDPAMKGASG